MKSIKIGTRNSRLATWQAQAVQQLLQQHHIDSELVFIETTGDIKQDKPLHEIGSIGLFTKALDDALLNGVIDCAVHSCKDLPSTLIDEIVIAAHLPREDYRDILVCNTNPDVIFHSHYPAIIATGSIRRKQQWLTQFPNHQIVDLRGNVDTRLNKLKNNTWDAAIFAYAGLKRLNIIPEKFIFPELLIPAAAQGVVAVTCKKNDVTIIEALQKINHEPTAITTTIERDILRLLDGGCVTPIGILATVNNNEIHITTSTLEIATEKMQQHTFSYSTSLLTQVATLTFSALQKK